MNQLECTPDRTLVELNAASFYVKMDAADDIKRRFDQLRSQYIQWSAQWKTLQKV